MPYITYFSVNVRAGIFLKATLSCYESWSHTLKVFFLVNLTRAQGKECWEY
jgi:hypothetical protein